MTADPLTAALKRGVCDPVVCTLSEADALAEAEALVAEAERGEYSAWLLSRAIDIAVQFPESERLQYYVGKLMDLSGDEDTACLCWRGIAERFPNSFNIFPEYFRAIAKTIDPLAASAVLDNYRHGSDRSMDAERAIAIARCRVVLGENDAALSVLDGVGNPGEFTSQLAIEKARLLRMEGRFDEALTLVETAGAADIDPALVDDMRRAATLFQGRHIDGPPSVAALEILIESAIERRLAHPPKRRAAAPAGVVLIGATLGGGGAERQLVNTALGLTERSRAGEPPLGPVSIFCRKLDRRRANDFYLSQLEAADIRVADYLSAQPWGGDHSTSLAGESGELVALLPPQMREGVARLADILRYEAPDVVQIWQDGMIFASGLAALLANVPRIVLNVRTMPPSTRTDRRKPEQETLYRGLVAADGVSLTANSRIAARAYEEWLDLPADSVATVANGVEPLPAAAPESEQTQWEQFDARTGNAGFVLGGIMRFDDNKRPLLWLEICKALAQQVPDARFILAGHGPLRSAAEAFARSEGIFGRTLFVGRTAHVGFWLEKMDALALTSRHEGVPNVLIEAQLAGVPVVTTPAGGAPEAVAQDPANLVLPDAAEPNADIVAAHLKSLAARKAGGSACHDGLQQWATDRFSMEHMIDRTLDIFTLE